MGHGDNVLVSVIVPVYKVEPYLDKCVRSILGQSFLDFELILVDDGSPDNCGRMCDEWAEKDARIRPCIPQSLLSRQISHAVTLSRSCRTERRKKSVTYRKMTSICVICLLDGIIKIQFRHSHAGEFT